jgi:peptide deformylase
MADFSRAAACVDNQNHGSAQHTQLPGQAPAQGRQARCSGRWQAATQVDVHERVIVIDVSDTHDQLQVFINPEIVWASEEKKDNEEGCLSVPGVYDFVERPERVRVRALNEKGETYEIDCEGLLAVCIQHEMDHLMGRVFVEYLSSLKQTRIRGKMKKLEKAL